MGLFCIVMLTLVELAGPVLAERKSDGTPWHPHHIAERYGLLAIIALGEVMLGTVASLDAVIDESGWTFDVVLFVLGGVGLTFGMWWVYFLLPAGEVLAHRRDRSWRVGLRALLRVRLDRRGRRRPARRRALPRARGRTSAPRR